MIYVISVNQNPAEERVTIKYSRAENKTGKTSKLLQLILNIDEKEFPKKYWDIIHRLQQAYSDTDVRQQMSVEDIYIADCWNT